MALHKIKSRCLIAVTFLTVVYSAKDDKLTTKVNLSEVLGQISKVNDLIRDLIGNYKELKQITNLDLDSGFDGHKQTIVFQEVGEDENITIKKEPYEIVTDSSNHDVLVTAMLLSDSDSGLETEARNEALETKNRFKKVKQKKTKDVMRNKAIPPIYQDPSSEMIIPESTVPEIKPQSKGESLRPDTSRDLMMVPYSDDSLAHDEIITPNYHSYAIAPTTEFPKSDLPSKKLLEPRKWLGLRKASGHRDTAMKTVADSIASKKRKREIHREPTKTKSVQLKVHPKRVSVSKEEIKTHALRKAYGDACLRLVVRRCYMACRRVSKETCSGRRKCTKTFKATFKKAAIRRCDEEFNNISGSLRNANRGTPSGDKLVDITRENLAMACLPGIHKIKPRAATAPKTAKPTKKLARKLTAPAAKKENRTVKANSLRSLNILRDRYEKACQRETATRCFKVCKGATTEACGKEKCKERKKAALVKACKRRCRQEYGVAETKSDSGSSSSASKSKSEEDW